MIKNSISLVLVTLNERKNLSILIPRLKKLLNSYKHEIIIVDDSSKDGTIELVRNFQKRYKNIRLIIRKNVKGFGSAIKRGYDAARNDIIVSMDADLGLKENEILKMIKLINNGYDLIIGSRHIKSGKYEGTVLGIKLKKFVSTLGNKYVSFISGVKVHDFSLNFRAIKRKVWRSFKTEEVNNSILMEMIIKTKYNNYKIKEIPVSFRDRRYGESKMNLKKQALVFFLSATKLSLKNRLTVH